MKKLLLIIPLFFIFSCEKEIPTLPDPCENSVEIVEEKIKGGSILQTWQLADAFYNLQLKEKTNANWIALTPLISINKSGENTPSKPYKFPTHDEVYKMHEIIKNVRLNGIENIMIKPLTAFWSVDGGHYWVDFHVKSEEEWEEIEAAYEEFYYGFAELSVIYPEFKLLSIGNELKEFSRRRPAFFSRLAKRIKTDFPNLKLTYSSNWDEFSHVEFWGDLDYIGVNSYFPLINKKTPSVEDVEKGYAPVKEKLQEFSCTYQKPVLFTEYGFRSIDYAAWKHWELPEFSDNVNFEAQNNGYIGFYNTFWEEDWMHGGFFWEWYFGSIPDENKTTWIVNNKPVEEIIKNVYKN
ncbi:glycoside hydrolase family 113 [Aureivirga sp. CE67]|uniref:glycoside hydrolase family 113 n=1 Tax=Aureivirga sp. CE67 TaxID=1788983 RepID=UPI0018CB51F3|nr:hypothetical protein [Aureivirga sp. CE67]